ncbi:hypothetical protein HDR66_01370 [bacterium]|nr:hypothetical protein [bacterium]
MSATASSNRASALRISPSGTTTATGGTKTIARTSSMSQPLTTQKITSTLTSATSTSSSGSVASISGSASSALRAPSVKYQTSQSSSSQQNKIEELEYKIEQLQTELNRKAEAEAVLTLLDKIYSNVNGDIASL